MVRKHVTKRHFRPDPVPSGTPNLQEPVAQRRAVPVVIMGYGKAGRLHRACFAKLNAVAPAAKIEWVVEPQRDQWDRSSQNNMSSSNWVSSLEELAASGVDGAAEGLIYDICTPTCVHYDNLRYCADLGARVVFVEKPLCLDPDDAIDAMKRIPQLFVVENYLYSTVTRQLKRTLDELVLEPECVLTYFTKDRVKDSLRQRGASAASCRLPHVFSVEMPHQLSVSIYLLGPVLQIEEALSAPMDVNGLSIERHGAGLIRAEHGGGLWSAHYSSLVQPRARRVFVRCRCGTVVEGYYATDNTLVGRVIVRRGGRVISQKVLFDDSLTRTLEAGVEESKFGISGEPPNRCGPAEAKNWIGVAAVSAMASAIHRDGSTKTLKTGMSLPGFLQRHGASKELYGLL